MFEWKGAHYRESGAGKPVGKPPEAYGRFYQEEFRLRGLVMGRNRLASPPRPALLYHSRQYFRGRPPSFLEPYPLHPRSVLFRREPDWRASPRVHAPCAIHSWLAESASLTARLRRTAGSGVGVQLLDQGFCKPFAGESALLGMATRRHALVREVLLRGEGGPLVLARTVIPAQALRGEHCGLARLGNRPLGEVLFAQRGLKRTRLDFAKLNPADWQPAVAQEYGLEGPVWGRRSLYTLGGVSLLVCEFFLPAVLSLAEFCNG